MSGSINQSRHGNKSSSFVNLVLDESEDNSLFFVWMDNFIYKLFKLNKNDIDSWILTPPQGILIQTTRHHLKN